MNKILAGLLSFVLFLFPNCPYALGYQQSLSFDPTKVINDVEVAANRAESLNMTVQIRATNGVGEWHE